MFIILGLVIGLPLGFAAGRVRSRRIAALRADAIGIVRHISSLKQLRPWKQVKEDYNPRHSSRVRVHRSVRARLDAWWITTQPRQWQVREKVTRG